MEKFTMPNVVHSVILLAAISFLPLRSAAQGYEMDLAVKPTTITLGEPVTLEITVRNLAQESRLFEFRDSGTKAMQISIARPSGQRLRMIAEAPPSILDGLYRKTLKRGELLSFSLLLSERFNLNAEGTYTVSVSDAVLDAGASSSFVIAAANPAALRRRCEELLQKTRVTNAQQSLFAARSLATIKDPIVIPFLEEMASSNKSPIIAIDALAQFGTVQAVDALGRLYRHRTSSSLEALAILDRLRTIQRVTDKSIIRERVQAVLSSINDR